MKYVFQLIFKDDVTGDHRIRLVCIAPDGIFNETEAFYYAWNEAVNFKCPGYTLIGCMLIKKKWRKHK